MKTNNKTLTAAQVIAQVIRKATSNLEKANTVLCHSVAFGLAYLIVHQGRTVAEAVKDVWDASKEAGKALPYSPNRYMDMVPVACELASGMKGPDCFRKGKNGEIIGLAIPTGKDLWPTVLAAKAILEVSGLDGQKLLAADAVTQVEWSVIATEAMDAAKERADYEQAAKDKDWNKFTDADRKRMTLKALRANAKDVRDARKEGETATAAKQSDAAFVVALIVAHRDGYSDADHEEIQAALNGAG